ncbi:SusC/RagA family TonB-linked outer membrane protein [Sphingobacterium sp. LRF_L2]|uniref:SusC/RagA family TonB-linked outer membrane protein n=1 Tax=Sphingobacterium sp. LRF_L2 TaxID=3369421 RepID=UPI003F60F756
MKLISLLLLGGFISLHAASYSQNITLNHKNISYSGLFKEVFNQSGYRILINKAILNDKKRLAITVKDMPVEEFLNFVFEKEKLHYKKDGNNIFLFRSTDTSNEESVAYQELLDLKGKVVDSLSKPLIGASVTAFSSEGKKLPIATKTGADGRFILLGVPTDGSVRIAFVGYKSKSIPVKEDVGNVVLLVDNTGIEEVVVTGLAVGTNKYKVPFAVTKVESSLINTVPAIDLSQSLRGKVAGISIIQTEGDEGATVSLRDAKSFSGNIDPLIVVDGYVSNLRLSELNPQDVESIEIIKGAAAAALYGTRAEGGVIQVITKKGKDAQGRLNITLDNEYGVNNVQRLPQLATLHRWKTDPDDQFGFAYLADQNGNSTTTRIPNYAENGFSMVLSPYKNYYDNAELLLSDKPYYTNFLSLANAGERYNTYLSFQNQRNAGVVEPIDANIRRTAKLNLELRPNEKWTIETNVHYFYNSRPSVMASGGGAYTLFGNVLLQEPFLNLDERDADGDWVVAPAGYNIQTLNLNFNPLYEYNTREYKNREHEILAGGKIRYAILKNLSAEISGSINQSFVNVSSLYPKGYKTVLENVELNNGNLYLYTGRSNFINGQAQINYQERIGDFDFAASAKSVYEHYYNSSFSAQGYNFSVPLYTLANTQAGGRSIAGSDEPTGKTVNYGYFLNLRTGYQDKIFVDVLGRIDQSSRYGSDAQSAFFPRVSLGYRLTQDFSLGDKIDELKLRASWGKAGRIPDFNAKESLATVTNTGISITQNENTRLERSSTSELELGFDAKLFKKLDVTFNYAKANSRGDFIRPPAFIPTMGVTPAYKNFGLIGSSSFELETRATGIVDQRNFKLDLGLTFARTRSEIKELGDGLPPFYSGIYRKDIGLSPWAFFGQKILTSLNELDVVDGVVKNAAGGTHPLADFVVNKQGHVVLASAMGTATESPLILQENGVSKGMVIGDAQPDFITGLNISMTLFNSVQLYSTLDWQQGGSKYSRTTQYLTGFDRSGLWQEYAQAGLPNSYIQALYNGNSYTSFWIEDSSYLSLREISLSYSLPKIRSLQAVRIAVTGRNLYTWSNFSGSNPEGYFDEYPYPVYRTFTAKLTVNF